MKLTNMVIVMEEVNRLYHQGYIEKINPSPLKSQLSLKEARIWLKEAQLNCSSGGYRSSRIACYMAFFHAARSVLLRDGYQEDKPEYLALYLQKYYREGLLEEEWTDLLQWMLNLHHQDLYHFQAFPSPEEADEAIEQGNDFVERISILLDETNYAKKAFLKQNAVQRAYL